jgi:hypothetical protein
VFDCVATPLCLTSREPALIGALLLCDHVYTFLPAPDGEESEPALRAALDASPSYRRLMNQWLAYAPLAEPGGPFTQVIRTLASNTPGQASRHDPLPFIRFAANQLTADPRWTKLTPLDRPGRLAFSLEALEAFSADLLRGSPDVGGALVIAAGLDAFAAHHHIPVLRAGPMHLNRSASAAFGTMAPGSLAQQAEAKIGEPLATIGILLPTHASATTLALLREALDAPLAMLRRAITSVINQASLQAPRQTSPPAVAALRALVTPWNHALEAAVTEMEEADDVTPRRCKISLVSVALRRSPVDVTYLAAAAAQAQASGKLATIPPLAADAPSLITMTLTPLNVSPLGPK